MQPVATKNPFSRQALFAAALAGATFLAAQAQAATLSIEPVNGSSFDEGSIVDLKLNITNIPSGTGGGNGSFSVSGGSPSGTSFPFSFGFVSGTSKSVTQPVTFADEGAVSWSTSGTLQEEGSSSNLNTSGNFFTINNVDPVIDTPQGDATVDFGVSSLFNFGAGASDAGVNDVLTYNWDLDGDGQYDDFTGSSGSFDYATLLPGLSDGVISAALRVDDGDGGDAISTFEVTITGLAVPEPASLALLSLGATLALRRRAR